MPFKAKHDPMKQLHPFILVSVFVFLLTAPSTIFAQKTQSQHQPKSAVVNISTSKPVVTTKKTTPSTATKKSQISATPVQSRSRVTNDRYKDGQSKHPDYSGNKSPQFANSFDSNAPSTNTVNMNAALVMVTDAEVINYKRALRLNRHCGCGGDITFINTTQDTLDMYFRYIKPSNTPSIEGVVLPPISVNRLYAPFYIEPGDSAIIRGGCRGALQYEARSRRRRNQQGHSMNARLEFFNFVRMSCMPREVLFKEE